MTPLIVLPAAGASSRMRGRDKLLEVVDGRALLRRQAEAAVLTGWDVAVLVHPDQAERMAVLDGLDIQIVTVPDARDGMSATLKVAASLAKPDQPLCLLLPDVPGIGPREIGFVCAAFVKSGGAKITRGSDPEGHPGTPIVFPHATLKGFADLSGDDGGRSLIDPNALIKVHFPDDRATRDLDTPEEWAKWRADTNRSGEADSA